MGQFRALSLGCVSMPNRAGGFLSLAMEIWRLSWLKQPSTSCKRFAVIFSSFHSNCNFALRMLCPIIIAGWPINGTPWTVNQDKAISDELVVGMGFAEFSGSRFEDR